MIKQQKTPAFTLIEILVVLIIVLGVAAMALPKFNTFVERFHAEDGKQILYGIYGAQKRYFLENKTYTASMAALDITLPVNNDFSLIEPMNDLEDGITYVGRGIRRKSGVDLYTLWVDSEGNIYCENGATPGYCQRMGFQLIKS